MLGKLNRLHQMCIKLFRLRTPTAGLESCVWCDVFKKYWIMFAFQLSPNWLWEWFQLIPVLFSDLLARVEKQKHIKCAFKKLGANDAHTFKMRAFMLIKLLFFRSKTFPSFNIVCMIFWPLSKLLSVISHNEFFSAVLLIHFVWKAEEKRRGKSYQLESEWKLCPKQ